MLCPPGYSPSSLLEKKEEEEEKEEKEEKEEEEYKVRTDSNCPTEPYEAVCLGTLLL